MRRFKFRWLMLLGVIAVFGLIITGCGQKKAADKGPLTVATSGTLYPTSYHDQKTNKLTGFDVEVVRAVGKKLGRKVVFKEMNVDGQETAVKTGKADMAANDFSVSPQKKRNLHYRRHISTRLIVLLFERKTIQAFIHGPILKAKKLLARRGPITNVLQSN